MTKEQAIEILTKKVDSWKCKRPRNPIIFKGLINEIDTENNAIETVLNMLKENSAEIEQKNTELAEKNAEIERLNRQIDLMAEEINETDRGYIDYCQFKMVCDRNCKECIKQYFERKSEE